MFNWILKELNELKKCSGFFKRIKICKLIKDVQILSVRTRLSLGERSFLNDLIHMLEEGIL